MRPVVVVGAGLAGLACAHALLRRGLAVRLLEASDEVGGVMRTDRVDGFLIDRGFQVLQTAYPEVRCRLDLPALRLSPFRPGARVWRGGRWRTVADPVRRPQDALATLGSGLVSPGDAWRILRLRRRLGALPLETVLTAPAEDTAAALRRRGFSPELVEAFLRPFFRGVFLEEELATSSRLFDFSFKMFAAGDAALPAEGIAAIPHQLAARLPAGVLELESPVAAADAEGVTLAAGARIDAAAVVVATDAATAAHLLPGLEEPAWNGVTTLSFDAPAAPVRGPHLLLMAEGGGPVSHLCFPSEVAPGYAPRGRALASVSVLGVPAEDDARVAGRVREQLRACFGARVDAWRLLRVDRVPRALPRQDCARTEPVTKLVAVGSRRFVCGGHRETSSIGGALRSGRRAAAAVLRAIEAA